MVLIKNPIRITTNENDIYSMFMTALNNDGIDFR